MLQSNPTTLPVLFCKAAAHLQHGHQPKKKRGRCCSLGVCFGWEPGATLGGLRAAVGAAGGTPRAEFLQLIYERNARSF